LLAYLLSLNTEWRDTTITVRCVASSEVAVAEAESDLQELIPQARIPARSEVVLKPVDRTVAEVMHEASREAEVVFMGLMDPEPGEERAYAERLMEMTEDFPSVVLVRNAGMFVGKLLEENTAVVEESTPLQSQ